MQGKDRLRSTMKERFGRLVGGGEALPSVERRRRVQKNLSVLEQDAIRLKKLAERERISQARVLERALDAYEQIYGRLGG